MRTIIAYICECDTAERYLVQGLLQLLFGYRAQVQVYDWSEDGVREVAEENVNAPALIILSPEPIPHEGPKIWDIVRKIYPTVPTIWLGSSGGSKVFKPQNNEITESIDVSVPLHKEDALRELFETISQLTSIRPTINL
jgi:hypothetical protein